MALYVIGITGNDVNRNRRLALHLQTFLDQTYKDFIKHQIIENTCKFSLKTLPIPLIKQQLLY